MVSSHCFNFRDYFLYLPLIGGVQPLRYQIVMLYLDREQVVNPISIVKRPSGLLSCHVLAIPFNFSLQAHPIQPPYSCQFLSTYASLALLSQFQVSINNLLIKNSVSPFYKDVHIIR